MVPIWWKKIMAMTLTLKDIPDELYTRLKLSAELHRRSLNNEVIACLEAVLLPTELPVGERLARARELGGALPRRKFQARDVDATKRQGRP